MKKNKKKNQNNKSLFKKLKASMPNNRVLYSILGAVGAGVVIRTAMDKDKRQAVVDKVTSTFQGLKSQTSETNTNMTTDPKIAIG